MNISSRGGIYINDHLFTSDGLLKLTFDDNILNLNRVNVSAHGGDLIILSERSHIEAQAPIKLQTTDSDFDLHIDILLTRDSMESHSIIRAQVEFFYKKHFSK